MVICGNCNKEFDLNEGFNPHSEEQTEIMHRFGVLAPLIPLCRPCEEKFIRGVVLKIPLERENDFVRGPKGLVKKELNCQEIGKFYIYRVEDSYYSGMVVSSRLLSYEEQDCQREYSLLGEIEGTMRGDIAQLMKLYGFIGYGGGD